ncbi:hypothetical protein [Blastococcus brunescens]|uniref:Nickel/cobalt efflux system n=1 Tax=Blastococcus brunescens TaxID=1564165 RepID=A0ABZ1AZW0_9ACTN|nr:hypothetical protein [Blastococcus sp. BMG 8361]WRL64055.1 hypothetical protein U6N30_31475 [Blastococcus sp. BMG 8361]
MESISDELRAYPDDLLSSPVDVRAFTVATEPGQNTGAGAALTPESGDPFSSALAAVDRWLEDLVGDRGLTPLVGTLAVLLAVLLGAGHALLPGHGKAVMAAYLAGRRGRTRDALTVGATVTVTHTAGVLVLGLALSLSSSLAGDQVIRWLGVASGLLVAGIGVLMLRGALRSRRPAHAATTPTIHELPEPALAGALPAGLRGDAAVHVSTAHTRSAGDHHGHEHPGAVPHGHDHAHDHDHDHAHDHAHGHAHGHDHGHGHGHGHGSWWAGGHSHGPAGHTHGPGAGRGG